MTVAAPEEWLVLGNGAATRVSPGRWELAETRPLATYFVTVCAGPYASVLDEHDGIPLGIHARASLRTHLEREAGQMLEVTRASFDYYHSLFGIRYPFGEYHQVFVPEFNAGAMENPGCVTFRDTMVFRGAAARDEVLARTNTIAHEMAHMWFGDLVTMQWWDDLWLNESFAEYMAHRTCVAATEFTDAWVDSTVARKAWGYAAERTPSTHPVAGSAAPDAQAALQDFDGISYAKGAATLRQLIAHIGDDAFIAGVGDYLRRHSYGNGTLADFMGFMEHASGQSLTDWSRAWLLTAGVDVISVDRAEGVVERTVPGRFPADRPHTMDVAGFTGGDEVFRVPVTITQDRTVVAALRDGPAAELVVPNASDLTWATVTLDPESVAAVPTALASVPDVQARAVRVDRAGRRRLPRHGGPTGARADLRPRLAGRGQRLDPEPHGAGPPGPDHPHLPASRRARVGRGGRGRARPQQVLAAARPGSTRALVAARTVARSSGDETLLRAWAAAKDRPAGLEEDSDFGWIAVRNLAARGLVDEDFVEGRRADDDTLQGRLNALMARAAMPGADAKAWAWSELTTNRSRSNYELNALAQGFWLADDLAVVRPYAERYFADVPAMSDWVGEDAIARVATLAYPGRVVEDATVERSEATLGGGGLTAGVRRSMVDAESQLREALRSRATFG